MKGVVFAFAVSSFLTSTKGKFTHVCNIETNINHDDLFKRFNYVLLFVGLKSISIFFEGKLLLTDICSCDYRTLSYHDYSFVNK